MPKCDFNKVAKVVNTFQYVNTWILVFYFTTLHFKMLRLLKAVQLT